ncbi:TonB-dependent receptor [Alteromonas sp. 5E99-2]|uniref:TonB-dependent receptor n=1 Tax=Alteromonas sp. 5E99-2 TaxID=2817683 RepID=UPI001A98EEFE|nr:TonB-dependent receptor [Alteromonas sp. 5E99-2]MBO1256595.1 TonB-dependent receptor [Alteromonas sp. 5E99-2]
MFTKKHVLALTVSSILGTQVAIAQEQENAFETITVTSQKREQALQDVSVAVTAFSGDLLRELNLTDSVDIASQTPGLNIGTPVGEGNNPAISLRGVGLNDFNDNNEGPVAVYRDDVYQSAMPGLTFQLFDLNRVEVLRGPQGTLYGRNATGGLVHFISNKPSDEFEGYADLTFGSYNQVKFEGAVSGALTDAVRGRLSVATNKHDGYVENRIGRDGNEADSQAFRLQIEADLSESVVALLNVHGAQSRTVAPKYQHEATAGEVDFFGYSDTDGDPFAGDYDRDGLLDIESTGASLTIDWLADNFDFKSITAVEYVDKIHEEESDTGPFAAIEPTFRADLEQFSQEFQVSGLFGNTNWIAGAYFFSSKAENGLDLDINYPEGFINIIDAETFGGGLQGVGAFTPTGDDGALSPFVTYDVDYEQNTDSYGLFFNTDTELSSEFNLVFGLRYTSEERDFDYINAFGDRGTETTSDDGAITNFLRFLNTLPVDDPDHFPDSWFAFNGDISNDNLSGKIGLDYRPNDDVLIFANYAIGFKAGGFNGGFLDLTDGVDPDSTPYDEEILTSYELGIKSTLADGKVRLNATAFYYDYDDYQALTFSGLSQFIDNTDAEIKGLDLELVWLPTKNIDINLGASFLDSEVGELTIQGETISGTELVLAPNVTLNGLIRWQATDALSFQIDANYQGEHFFDITNSDLSREDAYTVVGARIGYQISPNLNMSLFAKNLFDEEYRVYTFDFTSAGGFNQQFFGRPRWVGVNINYEF